MNKTKNNYVDLRNAREAGQIKTMQDILKEGHCPFCTKYLKLYHKQPILYEGKYWILTTNQWPYPNTKLHLLLILKYHAEKASEIRKGTGDEQYKIMAWAEKKFKIPGGAFGVGALAERLGKIEYTGATVRHIHAQYVIPDVEKLKPNEYVVFYIGKPLKTKKK